MGYILDSEIKYLKIVVDSQLDKQTVLAALNELIEHPEYSVKHTLWDLRRADNSLSMVDLKEIAGIMKLFKPRNQPFANKAVLLVSGKLNIAMANLFVGLTIPLLFEYKAFHDHEKAKIYLNS